MTKKKLQVNTKTKTKIIQEFTKTKTKIISEILLKLKLKLKVIHRSY